MQIALSRSTMSGSFPLFFGSRRLGGCDPASIALLLLGCEVLAGFDDGGRCAFGSEEEDEEEGAAEEDVLAERERSRAAFFFGAPEEEVGVRCEVERSRGGAGLVEDLRVDFSVRISRARSIEVCATGTEG